MSVSHVRPLRVALLGFTPFERSSFESYFRLAGGGSEGVVLVDEVSVADCLLADADDATLMGRLEYEELLARTLVIGNEVQPLAALQLPRPPNLALVMRALQAWRQSEDETQAAALPAPAVAARPTPAPARPSSAMPARVAQLARARSTLRGGGAAMFRSGGGIAPMVDTEAAPPEAVGSEEQRVLNMLAACPRSAGADLEVDTESSSLRD